LNCGDLERNDLRMDIGTEELSHHEIVGAVARLHLKPMKFDRDAAEADPPSRLPAAAASTSTTRWATRGPPLREDHGRARRRPAQQYPAEARAKIVHERLINFTSDAGTKDALQFLMTRECT
jgi:Mn-containing catalase